eukprot:s123_g27.t1
MALRVISGLKDVARLYRCVLFEASTLRLGPGGPCGAGALRSAKELLEREKMVAAVSGNALQAKAQMAALRDGGMPVGVQSWTSGELINRSLQGAELPAPEVLKALASPPRIFELGTFVKPRRWTELVQRNPPLEGLVKANLVKRVDSVEKADLCYWDAQDGDRLDHWLEAVVELCVDLQVPLLQPKWGAAALDAIAPLNDATGTLESVALKMKRLGGRLVSCGKLDGALEGLNFQGLAPRDVLLVTGCLGDLVEASQQGADVLLLVGAEVKQQLRTWTELEARHETQRRKTMSVSERVAEDSPRMMAAANNPFLSVFQLPSLLAEAAASNRKHREMKEREQRSKAAAAATAAVPPAETPEEEPKVKEKVADDVSELLERWCKATKVPLPVAVMSSSTLYWDGPEKETPATTAALRRPAPAASAAAPGSPRRRDRGAPRDEQAAAPGEESLESLLAQMEKSIRSSGRFCGENWIIGYYRADGELDLDEEAPVSKSNSKDISTASHGYSSSSAGPGTRTEAFLDGNSQWDASQSSSEAEAEVPLSFGEQLVLETYLRFRGRRYDRQRQEELCQPRRIKPPADRWSSGRREVLEKEQLEDLLKRLAGPKRGKATDSGELIALHSSKQEMVQRRVQAKDVEATFARLSAPKTARGYDPTPGEKVCLMYNQTSHRSVNLERLADMAQPKKRGGDLTEQLQQRSSCDDSEGVVSMSSAVATPKTIFLIGA